MTVERNVYAGDTTQTPNTAKPRPLAERIPLWFGLHATGWICTHPHGPDDITEELGHPEELVEPYALRHLNEHHTGWETPRPAARLGLDAIRTRANAATTGPWGVETTESDLMVLNRGIGLLVATAGTPDDTQAATDAEFIAHAREDIPALLDEITALDQVAEDAVALTEQIGAELRAARTEVDRLRRLLDTRDADYALVVRVDAEGRAQIDGSPGLTLGQAAEWLQELATDTARRAKPAPAPALCSVPCPHGHAHTCARSPKHTYPHRDVKQKGGESCTWWGQ